MHFVRRRWAAIAAVVWLVGLPVVYFLPALDVVDPDSEAPSAVGTPRFGLVVPVAGMLLLFVAMGAVGRLPARRLLPAERGLLGALVAVALGTGILTGAALLLAAVDALRPTALAAVTLACLACGVPLAVRAARATTRPSLRALPRPRVGVVEAACAVLLVVAGIYALLGALGPEVEFDARWYHLPLPAAWVEDGGLTDFACQYVSAYPFTTEVLFAYGLAFRGEVAAKLVHFGFGVLLVAATYDLGRRLFGRRAALAGAVVCATAPTMLWEATTAYIDLATAFFVVLALDVAVIHARAPARRTAIACGLVLGLAVSTKLLALLAVPGVALVLALGPARRAAGARLVDGALAGVLAVALCAPWLVRAEVLTGNPVLPSLYGLFGAEPDRWSPSSDAGLERFLDRFGEGDGVGALLALPWNVTMHGASFGGSFGVLPLLLAPFALTRRPRRETVLVVAAIVVFVLLWFSPLSSQQARFLVPALAMAAPIAGAGFDRLLTAAAGRSRLAGGAVAGLCATLAVLGLPPFTERHERDRSGDAGYLTHVVRETPLAYVLGAESRPEYLGRRVRTYAADRAIERLSGGRTRVLAFAGTDTGIAGVEHVPEYADCMNGVEAAGRNDREVVRRLRALGVTHVLWDARRRGEPQESRVADPAFERRYLRLVHRDPRALVFELRDGAAA